MPSAGPSTGTQRSTSETDDAAAGKEDAGDPQPEASATGETAGETSADQQARREELAKVDTQLDLEKSMGAEGEVKERVPELEDLPSAAASDPEPERDGEIRISADHPMAALYMQTPMPPEIRGNRGAGVLIAALATVCFAAIYAACISLWLAPSYPASTFWSEGLLPHVLTVGFASAVAVFFLSFVVLVLIAGKSGWWAYVIGGFPVAILTWMAAAIGAALHARYVLDDLNVTFDYMALGDVFALSTPAVLAAFVSREMVIWFGAWIGLRGRRVRQRNAEAQAEYDEAMADLRTKMP